MPRGGSRPNTGGKREGAGRKPEILPKLTASAPEDMPLDVLLAIMRDGKADQRVRLEAAKAAAPFLHARLGALGKKGERKHAAEKIVNGKFSPASVPRLMVSNSVMERPIK